MIGWLVSKQVGMRICASIAHNNRLLELCYVSQIMDVWDGMCYVPTYIRRMYILSPYQSFVHPSIYPSHITWSRLKNKQTIGLYEQIHELMREILSLTGTQQEMKFPLLIILFCWRNNFSITTKKVFFTTKMR